METYDRIRCGQIVHVYMLSFLVSLKTLGSKAISATYVHIVLHAIIVACAIYTYICRELPPCCGYEVTSVYCVMTM